VYQVYSRDESQKRNPNNKPKEPKDLREANENVRKSQGEDATGPADSKKSGNKPAFDRDR
jgi:hypothetical protein